MNYYNKLPFYLYHQGSEIKSMSNFGSGHKSRDGSWRGSWLWLGCGAKGVPMSWSISKLKYRSQTGKNNK